MNSKVLLAVVGLAALVTLGAYSLADGVTSASADSGHEAPFPTQTPTQPTSVFSMGATTTTEAQ